MAKRRPPRSRKPYKGNRTLLRALQRGLDVTARDIARFRPDTKDLVIVMAHLKGYVDPCGVESYARNLLDDEADDPILTAPEVQRRMEDPVRMAWISCKLMENQEMLCGFFWAAVYQRAYRGNDQAAKIWAQRFDPSFRPTTRTESVSANLDVSVVDDHTRQSMLERELRRLFGSPADAEGKIIDVPVETHEPRPAKNPEQLDARTGCSAAEGPPGPGAQAPPGREDSTS